MKNGKKSGKEILPDHYFRLIPTGHKAATSSICTSCWNQYFQFSSDVEFDGIEYFWCLWQPFL